MVGLELAYRKYLQFCWQLVSTVCKLVNVTFATDNFSFALTGHARARARALYLSQCQQAGTCHWLNFAVYAGLLRHFG
jgi:hypothetical protein